MVVAIHQPEHLPWLGFFEKASRADLFVMLDHVQYRKGYFQNRNRIRSSAGFIWLTVPVLLKGSSPQAINRVMINNESDLRWREKCFRSLAHCYRKAPFFALHAAFFEDLYRRDWKRLADLNETVIRYLLQAFSIPVPLVRSSALGTNAQKGDLILEICRKVGATTYLSGISGQEYLDMGRFGDQGIAVQIQEFHHPIYRQLHEPFLPCMSGIDLLFNHGPESQDILRGVGVSTMENVFA